MVTQDLLSQLHQAVLKISKGHKFLGIAVCGTLPPGLDGRIYEFIITSVCATRKSPHEKPVVLLDAYQNIECLESGLVDIIKINKEEGLKIVHYFMNTTFDMTVEQIGIEIQKHYKIPIIAITDGPFSSYLFEKKVWKYTLPDLGTLEVEVDHVKLCSSSLPEVTELSVGTGGKSVGTSKGLLETMMDMKLSKSGNKMLNPLGAGDTCSAIFLVEYLDTKVYFIKQDAVEAFKHGLAAASASCLEVDTTSHFSQTVKYAIFEKITYEQVYIKQ
jgi:fructose-1-phosphate kinase PfkB-like protein